RIFAFILPRLKVVSRFCGRRGCAALPCGKPRAFRCAVLIVMRLCLTLTRQTLTCAEAETRMCGQGRTSGKPEAFHKGGRQSRGPQNRPNRFTDTLSS